MLIQKETTDVKVSIKAYQAGEIRLNIGRFNEAVLLANGDKKNFKGAKYFNELTFEDLNRHFQLKPEVLIIGSGEKHLMLPIKITGQLNAMGIAVESMASRQACHTYQVLIYERRQVYALIYP